MSLALGGVVRRVAPRMHRVPTPRPETHAEPLESRGAPFPHAGRDGVSRIGVKAIVNRSALTSAGRGAR